MECEIKDWDVAQREICYDFRRQRSILRLVCSRILYYARRAVRTGYMDKETRTDIAARAVVRLRKDKNRARLGAGETEDVDEQRPLKIHHRDLPVDPPYQTFHELAKSMNLVALDELHEKKIEELMVQDPKRKARVPSRFCSFHLACFDLDAESKTPLGPPYQPDHHTVPWLRKYFDAKTKAQFNLARYTTEVISIRVVKVGPDYTYPVEIYGKVIARDQIDYKCVYLFNRKREDAQTINSEKDMLALSGPKRALVSLDCMYFEFDLKIKGKGDPVDDKPFSKGVISHFCNPYNKRVKYQLPSFQSTVKLVLQHVYIPVAASLKVSVVNQEPNDPPVHYDGKITAGTTRNYRHHVLLYDSIVRCGGLLGGDGSLALYRNVVAVSRCPLEEDEKLVFYVCFLDASCELEDVDKMDPEEEGDDDEDFYGDEEEVKEEVNQEVKEEVNQEVDPKNVVTLKYPQSEAIWEHRSTKLKVNVDWTAVLDIPDNPEGSDFRSRRNLLPNGRVPDYRHGIWIE